IRSAENPGDERSCPRKLPAESSHHLEFDSYPAGARGSPKPHEPGETRYAPSIAKSARFAAVRWSTFEKRWSCAAFATYDSGLRLNDVRRFPTRVPGRGSMTG